MKTNHRTFLCGVTTDATVEFKRAWYVVSFAAPGVEVKVNPRASRNGLPVLGNNAAVLFIAADKLESLAPSSKLGNQLRQWAASQCIEGKRWVQQNTPQPSGISG